MVGHVGGSRIFPSGDDLAVAIKDVYLPGADQFRGLTNLGKIIEGKFGLAGGGPHGAGGAELAVACQ